MMLKGFLEDGFDGLKVVFGVDADGVDRGGFDVHGDVVFKEAELFEAFGLLEGAGGKGGEATEGVGRVGVQADVLPELGVGMVRIAVKGDGGAGEVEGAAVGGSDDFDGVGIVDVLGGAGGA